MCRLSFVCNSCIDTNNFSQRVFREHDDAAFCDVDVFRALKSFFLVKRIFYFASDEIT